MDIPDNLKAFNYIAIRVFDRLYESFPRPEDIHGIKFVIECVIDEGGENENTKNLHLLNDTVSWLEEEGFLTTKGKTLDGNIHQARLTLRGLTVLGYIPVSVSEKQEKVTIIDNVKAVLGQGFRDSSAEAVRGVVASAFKLMAGYMANS